MRVLIDIGHPAHVHLFKHCIWNLERSGHEVIVTARKKEVTLNLLHAYGLTYYDLGEHYATTLGKASGMIKRNYKLYRIAKKFVPNILVGVHDPYIAQVGKLLRKPSITFTDTEHVRLSSKLTFPFTNVICTPACFKERLNPQKHVRYNGYHELAYLHPKYFAPDDTVLAGMGLSRNDQFIILRFISWGASHDVHLMGIDKGSALEFIKSLERYGRVFITSERKLSTELEQYRLAVPPEQMLSLLYYADLYIGEGGTMAAEAAILGTPAIHIESTSKGIATGNFSGNFLELRDTYDLLCFYPDQKHALEKAMSILEDTNSKKKWQQKREKLLEDKIDVTAWMTDFIERYPESFIGYKQQQQSKGTN